VSDESKTTEPEELKVIYVGEIGDEFEYVLAENEQEAVDIVLTTWGGDADDFCLTVEDLGLAPRGLAESDIMNGCTVKPNLLISWLIERLHEAEASQDAEAKKVEALHAQAIEHGVDVVAYRHDLEVAEYERDQARKELEEKAKTASKKAIVNHTCPECADTTDTETEVVCPSCSYGFCKRCCKPGELCDECQAEEGRE